MENPDLKWIKKHYGEKFSHLCRDLFPTLLETEGLLKKLISEHFPPSRELYDDLIKKNLTANFKKYIYGLIDESKETKKIDLSPEELMDKAGYILYPECQTEEDIQKFRHYYYRGEPTPEYNGGTPVLYKGEELCTFNGGRLRSCRVWFAVKKNVDQIRREDFQNPRREDDYGISVISIQFSKTNPSTLSIKNRYNHTIKIISPDATFGNDLDNIIEGLTQAFVDKFHINLVNQNSNTLEIPGYVQASDGKFYKYNLEINNVYYCPNNVIIEDGEVKTFDKDRYIVFDYFILDIKNKKIIDYNNIQKNDVLDFFPENVGEIEEIKRIPNRDGLTIQITPNQGEIIEISLNKHNEIVGYSNPNITEIGNNFLQHNKTLTQLSMPNVLEIGNNFLQFNEALTQPDLPNVQKIGNAFLCSNEALTQISLPNVQIIGDCFLSNNKTLSQISLPKVQKIGALFLCSNEALTQIYLPSLKEIERDYLDSNKTLRDSLHEFLENSVYNEKHPITR